MAMDRWMEKKYEGYDTNRAIDAAPARYRRTQLACIPNRVSACDILGAPDGL